MLAILDTNLLIDIERGNHAFLEAITEIRQGHPSFEPAVTWITFYEFYFGTIGNPEKEAKALELLGEFSFLGMDKDSTKIFSRLRRDNRNVKDFDLLIASIAIANGALLLTKDRDFEGVPDLRYRIIE